MKIYILLGHTERDSFNGQIAETYFEAAKAKGHEVRIDYLGEMRFDPVLRKGKNSSDKGLEADLLKARQNLLWCDKWVIVYPIWLGAVPAILKGFFDRALTSGFAFAYHKNDPLWDKLLTGRSAEIITTCDSPWWWVWLNNRNGDVNSVKRGTLAFCGFSPVKVTRVFRLRFLNNTKRQVWLDRIVAGIPRAQK